MYWSKKYEAVPNERCAVCGASLEGVVFYEASWDEWSEDWQWEWVERIWSVEPGIFSVCDECVDPWGRNMHRCDVSNWLRQHVQEYCVMQGIAIPKEVGIEEEHHEATCE